MESLEAGVVAVAGVLVDAVGAAAAVLARLRLALVDVHLAVVAGEAGEAGAAVLVDAVQARGVVLAPAPGALVEVVAAVAAGEAGPAVALVAAGGVLRIWVKVKMLGVCLDCLFQSIPVTRFHSTKSLLPASE